MPGVSVHTLRNTAGVELRVLEYGGIVQSLRVPDANGRLDDVVLGYDSADDYRDNPAYFGALVGRCAGRIAGARFALDGVEYLLAANDGANHIHGGVRGFDKATWRATRRGDRVLELEHTSPEGNEGYPGTLEARVTYTLTERNQLVVDYHATADRATPVNLTHHSYFNLAGHDAGDVREHVLVIDATRYLPVDAQMIPTGELRPVAGTPFDFRTRTPIGARIEEDDAQLAIGRGYDHCFVLGAGSSVGERATAEGNMRFAARVYEPSSGRVLEVWTTEPGLQLYTGNHLEGIVGKGSVRYVARAGVALETQHFPDAPNQPGFRSVILRPGETYRSRTIFGFGVGHG